MMMRNLCDSEYITSSPMLVPLAHSLHADPVQIARQELTRDLLLATHHTVITTPILERVSRELSGNLSNAPEGVNRYSEPNDGACESAVSNVKSANLRPFWSWSEDGRRSPIEVSANYTVPRVFAVRVRHFGAIAAVVFLTRT